MIFKNLLFNIPLSKERVSLVAQREKHLPAMWETQVRSLGREDPLEGIQCSCLENLMDVGAW